MNLSFTLDGNPAGTRVNNGTQGAVGYQSNANVFAMENLTEAPHTLLVDVNDGSAFLFDYMIYTHDVEDAMPTVSTTAANSAPTEDS